MKKYDTLVVGSGPAGIFTALEMAGQKEVAIIDAGKSLEEKKCYIDGENNCKYCKPVCHILGGFGGAQFFQGTKLSRYPAGTGLLNFCKDKQELEQLYDYVDDILEKFGKPERSYPAQEKIDLLRNQFAAIGVDLKYYNAQKVSNRQMNEIAHNIREQLEQAGVEIYLRERVIEIQQDGNDIIVTTTKDTYRVSNVVLAVGRLGSRQLVKMADRAGIYYSDGDQEIELGVRVEGHYSSFDHVDDVCNDIKLKSAINGGREEVRSFCQDYRGYITRCVYNLSGDKVMSSLDGHIMGTEENGGTMSDVVNLAVHHRFQYDGDLHDIYDIVGKMSIQGRPLVQTMGSFMGESEKYEDFSHQLSMPYAKPANINEFLPANTLNVIKNFINRINIVIPGFADTGNAVYSPSFEMGWKKMTLNSKLRTNIDGIYVGGDATGHFRGAMQAMVSGILIARNILEKR